MTFVLVDRRSPDRDLVVANRYWHAIATEVQRAHLLPEEQTERIFHQLCTPLNARDLRCIASCLREEKQARNLAELMGSALFEQIVSFMEQSEGLEIC